MEKSKKVVKNFYDQDAAMIAAMLCCSPFLYREGDVTEVLAVSALIDQWAKVRQHHNSSVVHLHVPSYLQMTYEYDL